MDEVVVTASGTVIVPVAKAIALLKANGTLDACRKYMKPTTHPTQEADK